MALWAASSLLETKHKKGGDQRASMKSVGNEFSALAISSRLPTAFKSPLHQPKRNWEHCLEEGIEAQTQSWDAASTLFDADFEKMLI